MGAFLGNSDSTNVTGNSIANDDGYIVIYAYDAKTGTTCLGYEIIPRRDPPPPLPKKEIEEFLLDTSFFAYVPVSRHFVKRIVPIAEGAPHNRLRKFLRWFKKLAGRYQ